ncbi:MAG: hypothetical protein HN344_07940, partial [Gammaproteobacteria bacterium]|nr:hypothetical protein [Gammaproteobacteria bacterium]
GDLIIGARNADPNGNENSGSSYVIFGGQNGWSSATDVGDDSANSLTGTAAVDNIIAGDDDDTLSGEGGADVLYGGAGDDTIHVSDNSFFRIDGGRGSDTLILGSSLDLTSLANNTITGIERIDLSSGDYTLTLSYHDLIAMTEGRNSLVSGSYGQLNHVLVVNGQTNDRVVLDNFWREVSNDNVTVDGTTGYSVYQHEGDQAYLVVNDNGSTTVEERPLISVSDQVVAEGQNVTFTVTLSNPSSQTITVDYATQESGALSPSDYTAVSGTLTFATGETSKTITITTIDDTVGEAGERIALQLSGATNATLINNSTVSVSLDGTDDYIVVADHAALDISGNLTLEGWFRPTEAVGIEILAARWNYTNSERSFQLYLSEGEIFYNLSDDGINSISSGGGTGASLAVDNWAHVALVYDQTSGAIHTYVDGALLHTRLISDSENPAFSSIHTGSSDLLFGDQQVGHGAYFQGQMDEVRLWSEARSQAEIQDNQYQELAGSENNLNGYWRLNEGFGNIIENSVSSGIDGTLINGSGWDSTLAQPLRSEIHPTAQTTTAVTFSGATGDHITIATQDVLKPTAALSLEAWVYFDLIESSLGSSTHTLIDSAGNDSGGVNSGYTLSAGGGEIALSIGQSAAWGTAT